MNKRKYAFASMFFCTVLNSVAQFFLKKASCYFTLDLSFFLNINLFFGGLLYALSLLFYLHALRHEKLSTMAPLLALQYIFVSLISYFIFHEAIFLVQIFGLIFILIGVVFIASEVRA